MKPVVLFPTMLAILLLSACQKERPPSLDSMYECHESEAWTIENTFQNLVGDWSWRRMTNPGAQSVAIPGDDILLLRFMADSTLLVIEEGEITQTSTWQVGIVDSDFFGIEADPPVEWIQGRIIFCEGWALFSDSYMDGLDHYFLRSP